MSMDKNYEKNWDELWADIILNKDGSVNIEQVKKELSDYSVFMENCSYVYDYITNGKISKPNTHWRSVTSEAEYIFQKKLEEAMQEYKDNND